MASDTYQIYAVKYAHQIVARPHPDGVVELQLASAVQPVSCLSQSLFGNGSELLSGIYSGSVNENHGASPRL